MNLQAQAVELLCRCDEIVDDGIELRVLKGLLTAVTSNTLHVHGQALLLVCPSLTHHCSYHHGSSPDNGKSNHDTDCQKRHLTVDSEQCIACSTSDRA